MDAVTVHTVPVTAHVNAETAHTVPVAIRPNFQPNATAHEKWRSHF